MLGWFNVFSVGDLDGSSLIGWGDFDAVLFRCWVEVVSGGSGIEYADVICKVRRWGDGNWNSCFVWDYGRV